MYVSIYVCTVCMCVCAASIDAIETLFELERISLGFTVDIA